MNTLALLLVAAATTGDGLGKPHVGGLKLFRHNAVVEGPAPPGGPIVTQPGGGMGGMGGAQSGRRFPNVRSQITFLEPRDMRISWQSAAGPNGEKVYTPGLTVPERYNFLQGYIYRLKITDFGRGGVALYPTIEVAPSTPATDAYLTHNAIPVQFTAEDFDQVVDGGNFVTKVIYLPDPKYQELAIAGVPETLVSTRLEPGVDPILEADKRGTILLIVRLGSINLEMNSGPVVGAPAAPPSVESVPVDAATPTITVPPTGATVIPAPAPATEPAPSPLVPAPASGVAPEPPKPSLPAPVPPATAPVPGASRRLPVPSVEPAPAVPATESGVAAPVSPNN